MKSNTYSELVLGSRTITVRLVEVYKKSEVLSEDQSLKRAIEARRLLGLNAFKKTCILTIIGIDIDHKADRIVLVDLDTLKKRFAQAATSGLQIVEFQGGRFTPREQMEALQKNKILFASDTLDPNVYAHDVMDHVYGWLMFSGTIAQHLSERATALLQSTSQSTMTEFADVIDQVTSEFLEHWSDEADTAWLVSALQRLLPEQTITQQMITDMVAHRDNLLAKYL